MKFQETFKYLFCFVITLFLLGTAFTQTKIRIPIIVHVVYKNAEQKVSSEEIMEAIKGLNDDFNKRNKDIDHIPTPNESLPWDGSDALLKAAFNPANVGIEFDLYKINYLKTDKSTFNVDFAFYNNCEYSSLASKDELFTLHPRGWENIDKDYLNIWIINEFEDNSKKGLAYLPVNVKYETGSDKDYIDALVIERESIMAEDHILTHEVGHWLGLFHVWGLEHNCFRQEECAECTKCDDFDGCNKCDDLVEDTLPQTWKTGKKVKAKYPHVPIDISKICPRSGLSILTSHGYQFWNFMDYSPKRVMFTEGQKQRMLSFFEPNQARARFKKPLEQMDDVEPNNKLREAIWRERFSKIGNAQNETITITGNTYDQGVDYYRLTINQSGKLQIRLKNTFLCDDENERERWEDNHLVRLIDEDAREISFNAKKTTDCIKVDGTPKKVFIEVNPQENKWWEYEIELVWTPDEACSSFDYKSYLAHYEGEYKPEGENSGPYNFIIFRKNGQLFGRNPWDQEAFTLIPAQEEHTFYIEKGGTKIKFTVIENDISVSKFSAEFNDSEETATFRKISDRNSVFARYTGTYRQGTIEAQIFVEDGTLFLTTSNQRRYTLSLKGNYRIFQIKELEEYQIKFNFSEKKLPAYAFSLQKKDGSTPTKQQGVVSLLASGMFRAAPLEIDELMNRYFPGWSYAKLRGYNNFFLGKGAYYIPRKSREPFRPYYFSTDLNNDGKLDHILRTKGSMSVYSQIGKMYTNTLSKLVVFASNNKNGYDIYHLPGAEYLLIIFTLESYNGKFYPNGGIMTGLFEAGDGPEVFTFNNGIFIGDGITPYSKVHEYSNLGNALNNGRQFIAIEDNLLLHERPDLNSSVLYRIKQNEIIYYTDEQTVRSSPWLRVRTISGAIGWIQGKGIDLK